MSIQISFKNYQYCPYVTSKLSDNKTMISLSNLLTKVNNDFENRRYNFNHKTEMNLLTIANKLDMSQDLCIRHNMHAVERGWAKIDCYD